MKKKLSYLLFALIVVMPINIKALTGSVSISCDKESYNVEDTVTCDVKGSSDEEVYSISANVSSNNTTIDFKTDSSWQGNGEEGNIQLYTDEGKKGTFNIGKLTIKLKDKTNDELTANVLIKDIKFGDTDGVEVDISESKKDIKFSINNVKEDKENNNEEEKTSTINASNKITESNPKTADVNIIFIVLGIIIASFAIIIGYKKINKENI